MSRMTKRSAAAAAAAAIAAASSNSHNSQPTITTATTESPKKKETAPQQINGKTTASESTSSPVPPTPALVESPAEQTTVLMTKLEALPLEELVEPEANATAEAAAAAAEKEAENEIRKTNNAGHDDEEDDEEMEEEFVTDGNELLDEDEDDEGAEEGGGSSDNASNKSKNKQASKKADSEKLRRRLPMSVKELIDYHSSNGKSIKEIVNKINVVCRTDEKVSYGYVQKYLYRKKLEATTAKKARYYRKKYGFVYRRMRRKPVLTENHRSSRITWCLSHQNDHFDQDIFIGKTALKPFLASLNQLKGTPADPNQPRQQTTLHLWGAISRKGASPLQIFDGALTTAMYLEILLENVVPFIAENFPEGHRFHQDNNPKHSAKLSQEFLESTGINWVKSPPRSHDLNPIELVWTDLIQVVAKRLPKTIGQVVVAVKEYWKTLTPEKCSEFIDKLVDVVPKVIEKNGEWISMS